MCGFLGATRVWKAPGQLCLVLLLTSAPKEPWYPVLHGKCRERQIPALKNWDFLVWVGPSGFQVGPQCDLCPCFAPVMFYLWSVYCIGSTVIFQAAVSSRKQGMGYVQYFLSEISSFPGCAPVWVLICSSLLQARSSTCRAVSSEMILTAQQIIA